MDQSSASNGLIAPMAIEVPEAAVGDSELMGRVRNSMRRQCRELRLLIN